MKTISIKNDGKVKEVKRDGVLEDVSEKEAEKYLKLLQKLLRGKSRQLDVTKYPDFDILLALRMYPKSTLEDLTSFGFERFQNIFDSYVPDFVNKNLVEKSPEGRYSLTDKGEDYIISRYKELHPSIFSRIKNYCMKMVSK